MKKVYLATALFVLVQLLAGCDMLDLFGFGSSSTDEVDRVSAANAVLSPVDGAAVPVTALLTVQGTYNASEVSSVTVSLGELASRDATLTSASQSWAAAFSTSELATLADGSKLLTAIFRDSFGDTLDIEYVTVTVTGSSVGSYSISGTVAIPAGLDAVAETAMVVYVLKSDDSSVVTAQVFALSDIGYDGSSMDYDYTLDGIPAGYFTLGARIDKGGDFSDTDDMLANVYTTVVITDADLTGKNLALPAPTFDIIGTWYCASFNVGAETYAPVKAIVAADGIIEFWGVVDATDDTPGDGSLRYVIVSEGDPAAAEINVQYSLDTTHTYLSEAGGWVPDDGTYVQADPSDYVTFLAIDADSFTLQLDEGQNGYGDENDCTADFVRLQ